MLSPMALTLYYISNAANFKASLQCERETSQSGLYSHSQERKRLRLAQPGKSFNIVPP